MLCHEIKFGNCVKNKNSSFIKGTVKWSSLIIIKLPFLSKNMSEIFPLPLPRKTFALPFDFTWERPKKYFLLSAWHRELYGPGPQIFYSLIDINIYTLNLLVCNSGQYTYVKVYVSFSLFFKTWLTELILISSK